MDLERWQRIEQLYHAALERDAAQRDAFLAEACADDDALRREIKALLAANDKASGFLATPALELEAKRLAAEMPAVALALKAGQELSHYKILSRIGAGGMGEVFLAQDKILERRVALKLLPAQFTQNAERLQRFIREAKAASALNHPNIITIYEIGEVATALGKTHFIATEFIEGETLRTWTVDEEKRLRQILSNVIQVASALDAAHKAGIVHRDIKPENVMVRPDGLVKVLDFGLAKLTPQAAGSIDAEAQTRIQAVKTVPGMILGTLRYMSPEQARGRSVDARSDIFSLGVVLYEMLTEQPLFAGESDADVVAAIIHKQAPPLATYLPEVPSELDRIVQKALAKDREQRYQNARDLQIDLQTLKENSDLNVWLARSGSVTTGKTTAQVSSAMTAPRFSLRQLLFGLLVATLLAGAIWWLMLGRGRQVEMPPPESLKNVEVVNWQSTPGEGYSFGAFSPDGKWVAFTSTKDGSKNVWIKQAASGDAKLSTEDDFTNESPIWSPDGDEIAFVSMRGGQRGIWRKPPLGSTPVSLNTVALGDNYIWLRYWSKKNATIYYEQQQNLFALDVHSGQTRQITDLDSAKVCANSVSVSPDEKHTSYISINDDGTNSLWVVPVRGGPPIQITESFANARNTVWHSDGNRLFFSAKVDETYQIFVTDLAGHKPAQITFGERDSFVLDISADGAKILYGSSKEESDIWGVGVAKADEFAVAADISFELWPDVSPDNQMISYQASGNVSQGNKLLNSSILTKSVNAESKPFTLIKDGFLPKWSPDGKRLAFLRSVNNDFGLWTVNAVGGEEKQLTTGRLSPVAYSILPYHRLQSSDFGWSPDGSKLVYISKRSGQRNLWIIAADGTGDTQTTSNADPNLFLDCPLWSADGKRIAYSSITNNVTAGKNLTYSVWVTDTEAKNSEVIFKADSFVRLIGWSQTDRELILVTFNRKNQLITGRTTEVALIRVSTLTRETSTIAILPSTYFYNVHLSADRRQVAFTSHQDGKDNVWVIPASGGGAKRLTANNDPRLFFSSLAWSPDGRAIYFGKQVRYSQLSMITNFR